MSTSTASPRSGIKMDNSLIPPLAWIPLLPLLGALVNLTLGKKLKKSTVSFIAVGTVAGACAIAIYMVAVPLWHDFTGGQGGVGITQTVYTWIEVGQFKAQLAFRLDTLSAVM